jgi:hypothetical protein
VAPFLEKNLDKNRRIVVRVIKKEIGYGKKANILVVVE